MKHSIIVISLLLLFGFLRAQEADTLILHHPISKYDKIIYKRVIEFDDSKGLYHVRDYFENGQIQMKGIYSSFDKNIKEGLWCNYQTNTKEGLFVIWYKNGKIKSKTNFLKGQRHGLHEYWYPNGQRESTQNYLNGQKNGKCTWWNEDGSIQNELIFKKGLNQKPKDTNYHYLSYAPIDYEKDTAKKWPLIIYLHGGAHRGTDINKLYGYGIPDQIYRGREFSFIIVAPQCPINQRWTTDNWFENFYNEIAAKFRVDTNRVYLTGVSLGGSGTWFLAEKYPDKFAAIAPMCGFTSHIDFIDKNINRLIDIPIWAFHGKIDLVVPFEETERIIKRLKEKNKDLKFTTEPEIGHWIHWLIYTEKELYDWFLQHDKSKIYKN